IAWFLAPPRACTRLPARVPRSCTYWAIGVEPTKETAAMSGWSSRASTATLSPCTTLKTPAGRPASAQSWAMSTDADGGRSLGLRMKVSPQAMATGNIHMGTMAGKLNGVMPATTPSGWRKLKLSTPVETWSEYSPLSSCGMPQANSTTSSPRWTSPAASESTLPCSSVISAAMSSLRWCTSSRNLKRIPVRRDSEDCDHSSNAAAAAPTARSTSDCSARTTSACCSPVAGLNTGPRRLPEPVVSAPSIQCWMVLTLWFSLVVGGGADVRSGRRAGSRVGSRGLLTGDVGQVAGQPLADLVEVALDGRDDALG